MGYSNLLKGIRPNTLEGKVVSDADMLDAMGVLGIIRCLSYNLNKCEGPIFDRNIWPELNISQENYKKTSKGGGFINHFFEKLLKLKNLILTEAGKNEVKDRHEIMVVFLRQFFIEQNLDDWSNFLEIYIKEN